MDRRPKGGQREAAMKTLMLLIVCLGAVQAYSIEVGQPAPDTSLPSTSGKAVKLSDFKGSWVVLYFYPKAFTPGCTAESCSLRDANDEIKQRGAVILGVSADDLETQKQFKAKHNMPFDLLSDSKREMAKAFKTLALGGLFTQRKTFIINPEGRIAYIFDQVNPAMHSQQVLTILKQLQAKK